MTRRAAEIKLSLAVQLADRLPATAAALRVGRIDVGKAKAIAELTANLGDAEALAGVEERVLRRAGEQSVPELRRSLLRAMARVDPQANAKRHRAAREERFLRVQPCCDGMAELTGRMPAEDAMTVFGAVDSLARCAALDDPRSIDARRVDALVDLCRPGRGGGPDVRVVVAASTLLGLDDQPGELAGFGPIDAETVRRIAADPDATWRRL